MKTKETPQQAKKVQEIEKKDILKIKDLKNDVNKAEAIKEVERILKPISAEERISRAKIFNELVNKCQELKTIEEELNVFKASCDETKSKIELTSARGYKFSVGNPDTFKKVLDVIARDLENVKLIAEKKLLDYEI